MRRSWSLAGAVLALVLLATGCVGMPDSGPVNESDTSADSSEPEASSIDAIPPRPQAPPADIAKGFIDAMSAWPIQIGVAKQFLSEEAAGAWNPNAATITFEGAFPKEVTSRVATIELSQPERLDASGAWEGELPEADRELRFELVLEDGEYRITNPPDALIVRADWFAQRFVQMSLYFFDRTGRILVPEPVFVPRGDQLASTLVNRLLKPEESLQRISRSYLPTVDAGLSVPISSQGVASVDFGGTNAGPQDPDDDDLARMLAQVGWTLRQVPGIRAIRVSIGGEDVPVTGDGEYSVTEGEQYDPASSGADPLLYGLRGGRLVYGEPESLDPAPGPLGEPGNHGLRSISVNLHGSTCVGVSSDGTSLVSAPVRDHSGVTPTTLVRNKSSLLPPAWDFTDRLWVVDNTPNGARVAYRERGPLVPVQVPGVSGRDVKAFLISRDGTRFAAVVHKRAGDQVRAGRILFDDQGQVTGAGQTRQILVDGVDRANITDIAWISPTSVMVVRPISDVTSEVSTVPVDGAPTDSTSISVSGRAYDLAVAPDDSSQPYAVTRDGLYDLETSAIVPFFGGRVSSLGYVG